MSSILNGYLDFCQASPAVFALLHAIYLALTVMCWWMAFYPEARIVSERAPRTEWDVRR